MLGILVGFFSKSQADAVVAGVQVDSETMEDSKKCQWKVVRNIQKCAGWINLLLHRRKKTSKAVVNRGDGP